MEANKNKIIIMILFVLLGITVSFAQQKKKHLISKLTEE